MSTKCEECRWLTKLTINNKAVDMVCLNECSDYVSLNIEELPEDGCESICYINEQDNDIDRDDILKNTRSLFDEQ